MTLRFDRGTLVLSDAPNGVSLDEAPGVRWDRRVRAYRAPGRCHSALTQWLLAAGIRFEDLPTDAA